MVDGPNAAKGQEYRRFWTFRSTTPGRVDIVAMPGRSCEVPTQHNWKHIAIIQVSTNVVVSKVVLRNGGKLH